MNKRSILTLCLVIALLLTMTACAGQTTTTTAKPAGTTAGGTTAAATTANALAKIADSANVSPKGQFPIVKSGIKLTVATPVNAKVENIDTNELTKWIESTSGIDLVFTQLSPNDAQTQINLMFTSKQLPDLVWGYGFSYAALSDYVDGGYVAPLDDEIAAYGQNYQAFLDKVSVKNAEAYVKIDGKVYAVPTCTELITNIYAGYTFRYQGAWLDKLKLKEPTTLDEFYAMLVAFRDQDPNGNGKKDEIPMAGYKDANQTLRYIGNCFQYTDASNFQKVNNGKISFVANNDKFKQTIQYLKKLVDEKLYDPASFTQDAASLKTTNSQADTLVGVDANGNMISSVFDSTLERYHTMQPLGALKGPDGYQSTPIQPVAINRAMIMTTACKAPGAAYRLMDMMLSEEAAVRTRIGVKGKQWDTADQGVPGRDGAQSLYKLLTPQEWIQAKTNVIWDVESICYSNVMNHVSAVKDSSGYYEVGYYAGLKCQSSLMKTVTNEHLTSLIMSGEQSKKYEDLKTLITTYVNQNATLFILGDRPMSEWDAYVAEFKKMGVDEYVKLAQDAYDAMNKK